MLVDSQLQLLRKSVLVVGADGCETTPAQLPSKYGLVAEIDPQQGGKMYGKYFDLFIHNQLVRYVLLTIIR